MADAKSVANAVDRGAYPILVVEDEKNLGETLELYLKSKGFPCYLSSTLAGARRLFSESVPSPKIVILDIGLPDGNGLELARELRELHKDFVLLFLSAQNDPNVRVEGLEMGAHDYITKPFELKELTLRLERILANQQGLEKLPESIKAGKLTIFFRNYEVVDAKGNTIPLSQKEYGILKLLYQNMNQVVGRTEIIEQVWGEDSFPSNRTVDNYIVKLRKWSDTDPDRTLQFISVRGIGYKLALKQ